MTAQEAKQDATWNSLPRRIRKKIERTAKQGKYMVQFYPNDFLYRPYDVLSEHAITSINCLLEDLKVNNIDIKDYKILWHAGSLHLYERNFNLLEN